MGHMFAYIGAILGGIGTIATVCKTSQRTIPAGYVGMVFFFGRPSWNGRIIKSGKVWIPFWYKLKLCYVEDSNTDEGGEVTVERVQGGQAYANATLTYKITRELGVRKFLMGSENYADQITSFFLATVADAVAKATSLTDRADIAREIDKIVRLDPAMSNYGIHIVSVTLKTCAQTPASAIANRLDLATLFRGGSDSNIVPFPSQPHGTSATA